jgi:hypothetical protein
MSPAAAGSGSEPLSAQDVADRGDGGNDAELLELAMDPPVAPPRVLGRQPDDEVPNVSGDGRPTGTAPSPVQAPFPFDYLPVPPQQRGGSDDEG